MGKEAERLKCSCNYLPPKKHIENTCARFYSGKNSVIFIFITLTIDIFNGFLINQFLYINLCLTVCKQLHQKILGSTICTEQKITP